MSRPGIIPDFRAPAAWKPAQRGRLLFFRTIGSTCANRASSNFSGDVSGRKKTEAKGDSRDGYHLSPVQSGMNEKTSFRRAARARQAKAKQAPCFARKIRTQLIENFNAATIKTVEVRGTVRADIAIDPAIM